MSKNKTLIEEISQVLKQRLVSSAFGKENVKKKVTKETSQLHKVVGQLVFSDSQKPLHNMEVELWDREIGTPDEYLGKGVTDKNGYFEIYYDPQEGDFTDAPDLELRVIETRFSFNANNEPVLSNRVAYIIKGLDDVTQKNYEFGTCCVPYWIYNSSAPFARMLFTDLEGSPDEDPIGRKLQGYETAKLLAPIKAKHIKANTLNPNQPSLQEIQNDYPPNLTIELEQKNPGYTRSDEYFGMRVLNGMNPCLLKKNKNNSNQYKVTFNWDSYEKNNIQDLHNVEASFEVKDGKLLPTSITIQSRYPDSYAPFSALKEPVTYTPQDGERWLEAKRIFRTNYFFSGAVIQHYIKAHLQTEQYAMAAFRNLRKNPVRLMLIPHLKSVINNNQNSEIALLSDAGFFTKSGFLTSKSLSQLCQDTMSKLDWSGWKPRQPLTDSHSYAKIANLYWQVLREYVDEFFEKHHDEIVKEWAEIHRFSDDLVEHSAVYKPAHENNCNPNSDSDEWYDLNELDKPDIPRSTFKGLLKAIRPITASEKPKINDIQNLKQLCRYVIFHATLWHSWVNDLQLDDGGEIAYSSLGLRNGSFGSEDDPAIAPQPTAGTFLLFSGNLLKSVKYGYILKNEDGDIPEEFRTILLRYKKDFADLGFDAGNIRSLINI